jgi:hypothetical protein
MRDKTEMASGLQRNLALAKLAMDYTHGTLPKGANNKWLDMIASLGRNRYRVRNMRECRLHVSA